LLPSLRPASLDYGVSLASGLTKPETLSFLDEEEAFNPLDRGFSAQAPPAIGGRLPSLIVCISGPVGTRATGWPRRGHGTFTKIDVAAEAATSYCAATTYLPRASFYSRA
jgi:hypothetical protein